MALPDSPSIRQLAHKVILAVILDRVFSIPASAWLLLASAFALVVTLRLVPRREGPGRRDLIGFLWATVWWSGCAMTENLPLPADYRLVFGNLAWFSVTLAPLLACFLLWSSTFGSRRPVSTTLRAIAIAVSLGVCLVAFINPAHSMYQQVIASPNDNGPLHYVHGLFFYLTVSVLYIIVLLTMAITAWAQRRLSARRRRIHVGIVLAISVPLVASAFYATGMLLVFAYDPTPFTFLLTAPLLAWLLAYNDLCDPLPIARRALLDVLTDSVIILDNDGRIVDLNQAAYNLAQVPPRPLGTVFSKLSYWQQTVNSSLAQPRQPISVRLPLDPPQYFELTTTVLEDSGVVAGHLLLLRDMTHRQETENRLQATLDALNVQLADNLVLQADLHGQARRDPLTGLYNRRELEEALPSILSDAMQFSRPVSVAMIDLDHFKQINDNYGHVFGDSVLKVFATHLSHISRKNDLLYRLGGEEFLAVLPDTTPLEAAEVVGRWLESCRSGLMVEGQLLFIAFSAGINAVPTPESDLEMLVAHADNATYMAKRRGRNQVVCYNHADSTTTHLAVSETSNGSPIA
ncbi:diguanylate cyclase [Pseudomonas sp.]|uniref:diguanylate cyclase domain-containing protein n=1 Tax=Pseudomonas sp. TaxID=306 RepID=UPI0026284B57|nr:diguanylate cyclase [Pseudomonas sp.]